MKRKRECPYPITPFQSKPQATDKLHIIVVSYDRKLRGDVNEQQQEQKPDLSVDDYGLIV